MDIQKTAQINLFAELKKSEIRTFQNPEYNGFGIDDFGYFQEKLNALYDKFEIELNDNLTGRSPSLVVYLIDIQKTLGTILKAIHQYHREEIYETQSRNPELFRQNRLGYINNFFNFQKEIIYKTYGEIEQKLSIVSDSGILKSEEKPDPTVPDSHIPESLPGFSSQLKSNLSRKDLTVLWWLLSECDFIEFDTQKHLAKFLEQNFRYKEVDEGGDLYREMKSIESLLSHLKQNVTVKPEPSQIMIASKLRECFETFRTDIIDLLENHDLPTLDH